MRLHRDAKLDLLRRIPLFASCSEQELVRISSVADEIDLPAGRRLTREGTQGHELVVVVDGSAEVRQGDEVVNRIGGGDFVGEVALVTGQRRTATVVATTSVHALVIEEHAFQNLIAEDPGLKAKVERAAWEHLQHDAKPADA